MPNTVLDAEDSRVHRTKEVLPFQSLYLVDRKQPINVKTINKKISHSGKFTKKVSRGWGDLF